MATRARLFAFKVTTVVLAVLLTYLVLEFGYRWYVYRRFVAADYPVTIVNAPIYDDDTPGFYRPHTTFDWRQFDAQHNLVYRCRVSTNNRGFISANDYELEKPAGEFRIALIGDSMTGCITNDIPWGDLLERNLNADKAFKRRVGAQTVKVLNFGAPGAGFHAFARHDRDYAAAYRPDLVVVNYIEDDFPREGPVNLLADEPLPTTAMTSQRAFSAQVQAAQVLLVGPIKPESYERYADPLQIPEASPAFFFIVEDDAVTFDKEKIADIKHEVAYRFLKSRLWRSWHPHLLYRAFGRSFSLSYADRMFASLSYNVSGQVDHALQAIRGIQGRHPSVIILRNPLHPDFVGQGKQDYTRLLEERAPDLKIVRMEKYMFNRARA